MIPDCPRFHFPLCNSDLLVFESEVSDQLVVVDLIVAGNDNVVVLLESNGFHVGDATLIDLLLVRINPDIKVEIACPRCQNVEIPVAGMGVIHDVQTATRLPYTRRASCKAPSCAGQG